MTEKEPEVDEKSHVEVEESNKVVADVVEAVTGLKSRSRIVTK